MNAQQIISNETFQQFVLVEALTTISKDTGISVKSLFQQFPTNKALQETCAKIGAEVAKKLAA